MFVWGLLLGRSATAQGNAACSGPVQSVVGSVADASGATLPGAVVRASCGSRVEETTTDQDGSYRLRLATGSWQVAVTVAGFSPSSTTVTVTPETRHVGATTLQVASKDTAVTVTADAGLMATSAESASKSDTPILEQPFAISTVTNTQLLQQNVQTLNQALKYTAGITAEAYGPDPRGDWFFIRGNAADVYVDGLRLPQVVNSPNSFAAVQVDPYDIQHLEILKGPSSTLYGQSNLGGLVDAVSKRPSLLPHRSIQLQGGNFDRIQGGAEFSGPLNRSASLLYSVNGIARSSHTYVYGAKDDRFTFNPTLEWRPTLNTSLLVYGKFLHTDMGTGAVFLPLVGTLKPAPYGYLPTGFNDGDPVTDRYRKRQYMFGTRAEYRGANWSVSSAARYTHVNLIYRGLYMAAPSADYLSVIRVNFASLPVLDGVQTDTHALTHVRTGRLRHTLVGGLDYQWQKYQNRQGGVIAPSLSLSLLNPVYGVPYTSTPITTRVDQTQFQGGVYAQDEIKLAGFTMVAGGRYDQTAQESVTLATGVSVPQRPHAFTGRVGVSYQVAGIAPYASYSNSFLPAIGNAYGGVANPSGGKPFVPVRGSSYEGGIKYQLPHRLALITASGFSMLQNNRLTTDQSNPLYQTQTGQVRTIGYELQGTGTVLHSVDLSLSYAHIRPVVTRSNGTTAGSVGTDFHKELQPNSKDMVSLWAHYTVRRTALAGLGFGGGARYSGPKWGDAANTFQTPGYTLFDGALDYTLERWRFAVNSNNLLNKRYISACSSTTICYYGGTRSVIASVNFSF